MTGAAVGLVLSDGIVPVPRIVTPLGIRFRDVALDQPISQGLVVLFKARQLEDRPRAVAANPSGVFGFHALPQLHDLEYPRDPQVVTAAPSFPFVVMVADRVSRFLPVVFGVDLPLGASLSPPAYDRDPDPAPVLDAYLFSAPTRRMAWFSNWVGSACMGASSDWDNRLSG